MNLISKVRTFVPIDANRTYAGTNLNELSHIQQLIVEDSAVHIRKNPTPTIYTYKGFPDSWSYGNFSN